MLDAAYEGMLLAGKLEAARGVSKRVLLTRLGGGTFGNADASIDAARLRALRLASNHDLDVVIVSYGPPPPGMQDLVNGAGDAGGERQ